MSKLTPFIKWAGGKTQLLEQISTRMPKDYNHYYEPFLGGGAVLFAVKPKHAKINDINPFLVNVYKSIKEKPEEVIEQINQLDSVACDQSYYFHNRERFNQRIANRICDSYTAALFIWINKHCFNGLYRVNKKGLFNVPWNKKDACSIDENNIRNISKFLQNVCIYNLDFEEFCKDVEPGDFVYFDSPYVPISKTANFVSYDKDGFSLEDHIRLSELFKRLDRLGTKLMLSNSTADLVITLYNDYRIEVISAKRNVCCLGDKRTGEEVIITNYDF